MKFSEITSDQWDELRPYLDTCLLPITGLDGTEAPHETTARLEELRDWMDEIENPFRGRIVTYPALHYPTEEAIQGVDGICRNLRDVGFKYIILVSSRLSNVQAVIKEADLILSPSTIKSSDGASLRSLIALEIQRMWMEN